MARPSIAAERREEILTAFENCALRKGLAATTLNDVAEESGLQRSLIRHFVGNREEMVKGLIDRMVDRTTSSIEAAIDGAGDESDQEVLRILLQQMFADTVTNRLMVQLWQQSWQDETLHGELRNVYRRCVDQVNLRLFGDSSTP